MRRHKSWLAGRRGFSLIEALTASVIVTVAGAAMLLAIGQSLQASGNGIDSSRAVQSAQELLTEISACRWADPDEPTHWGPENGECYDRSRSGFDDLDDYDGWTGRPQTKGGTEHDAWQQRQFPDVRTHPYAAYTCTVRVEYVSSADVPLAAGLTSPYRRVTVEVNRQGRTLYRLRQTFFDLATFLGRDGWFDPNDKVEPVTVEAVP
jgi:Tfp pilus assembly protein PilV